MYERERGRRFIIVGIVVIALVIVAGVIYLLTRGSGSSNSPSAATNITPVTTSQVVVALQPVPQGTQLQAFQVTAYFAVATLPNTAVPPAAYSSLDQIEALISSAPQNTITSTQTIFQQEVIVPGMFSTLSEYQTSPTASFVIPFGYVAEAVSFDPINSVIGSITAGDDIDLIASLKAPTTPCGPPYPNPTCGLGNGGNGPQPQTQFVMTDIRVLSVNAPPPVTAGSAPVPTVVPSPGATPVPTPTAVPTAVPTGGGTLIVLVRYQQALELQHLKDFAWTISAVVRSSKQQTLLHLKTLPVTDKWFFVKTQTPLKSNPGY